MSMSNIYLVDTPECIRTAPLFGASNTRKKDLQNENNSLREQIVVLQNQIDAQVTEIQRLDKEVHASVSKQEHEQLEHKYRSICRRYDDLYTAKEVLQHEVDDLHQQNEELVLRISAQDEEIHKRSNEYDVLQYNYERIREWNEHLQTEINNLRRTLQPSRHDADNGQNPDENP